jgi:hypothetical protein
MNNDEFLQAMKQANDESIKDDEKIQHFLVWLHEKTASLASPYQESALRAFYCDIVEGTKSVNREISRMLDSNLDKDIDEVRGIAEQLRKSEYDGISFNPSRLHKFDLHRLINQAKILPAVDIVIDRNIAMECKRQAGGIVYLIQAVALLIRGDDKPFQVTMRHLINVFPEHDSYGIKEWRKRLIPPLSVYRNLKLDWQFSNEQKQLLDRYYYTNYFLLYCLQKSNASPEVQKEIQDTLLLPIVEIERRKSGITKKIPLDGSQESHAIPEVKETQEMLLLPTVEIEICSSNEVQQSVQKMLPSPIDENAQHQRDNKQSRPKLIKSDFYTKTLLYSSFLIALILYIVFVTVFRHYIWIL